MSGSHEHGGTFSYWKHGVGAWTYSSEIESDANGGYHSPSGAHSGQHDGFGGANTKNLLACTMQGDCFMKFRADANKNHDYGQPHVYSYITMPLRGPRRVLCVVLVTKSA